MENITEEKQNLIDELKQYIETRIKLARYQAIEKGTSITASVVTGIVSVIFIIITVFFASVTLALFLGSVCKSNWIGFGCVTLLYLIVVIIISVMKKRYIEPRIINILVKKLLTPKSS